MIADTFRVFSHVTFPELHWQRDLTQPSLYTIPSGFASRGDVLGPQFIGITGDICALQQQVGGEQESSLDTSQLERLDSQQAWIESRLEQMRHQRENPLLRCCVLAALLCAYGLFTDIWGGDILASRLSARLLDEIHAMDTWSGWQDHADLLLWLLNIGTTSTFDDTVRRAYERLCNERHRALLRPISRSWDELDTQLRKFIWSDEVHVASVGGFWS